MRLDLARGTLVAERYRLDEMLGQGGTALVWKATHLLTGRALAMKFLRAPLCQRSDVRQRFLREARAASAVDHPNVVEVYDVLELADTTPVIVMELLRGETFARRLSREPMLSLPDALEVLLPVVSAVGAAHAVGVIHRDLKPENVFLADDDGGLAIKVLDFGIAKLLLSDDSRDSGFTATGTMLGTPCYMAPEQGFGEKDVDHRADIWSIGAMLYQALAGGRPVEGDNLGQVLKKFLMHGITPIEASVPDLPSDVASLVMRMLARERAERPRDLREVRESLSRHSQLRTRAFAAPASSSSIAPDRLSTAAFKTLNELAVEPQIVAKDTPPGTERTHSVSQRPRNWTLFGATLGSALVGLVLWRMSVDVSVSASERATLEAAKPAPAPSAKKTESTPPSAPTSVSAVHLPERSLSTAAQPAVATGTAHVSKAPSARKAEANVSRAPPRSQPTPASTLQSDGLHEALPF